MFHRRPTRHLTRWLRPQNFLANAQHPLIVSSNADPALFSVLTSFAERYAIPVVQFWKVANAISTRSEMFGGETPRPLLAQADVVLVLDTIVPWMPGRMPTHPEAKVIQAGPDPLFSDLPVRSFPADVALTAEPASAIEALDKALSERKRTRFSHRRAPSRSVAPTQRTTRA